MKLKHYQFFFTTVCTELFTEFQTFVLNFYKRLIFRTFVIAEIQ